jgi:hypothetical protein
LHPTGSLFFPAAPSEDGIPHTRSPSELTWEAANKSRPINIIIIILKKYVDSESRNPARRTQVAAMRLVGHSGTALADEFRAPPPPPRAGPGTGR